MGFVGGFRSVESTRSARRYPAFIENLEALVAQSVAGSTSFVRRDGTLTLTGATWDTGGATDIVNVQRMSVGKATPTANTRMHLQESVAVGAVAPIVGDVLVVERSSVPAINLLTVAGGSSTFAFSDDVWGRGRIFYNHTGNFLDFAANSTPMMRTSSVGVRIESSITGNPADLFQVVGAVGGLLFEDLTGRFGVGTDTPLNTLNVQGGAGSGLVLENTGQGAGDGAVCSFYHNQTSRNAVGQIRSSLVNGADSVNRRASMILGVKISGTALGTITDILKLGETTYVEFLSTSQAVGLPKIAGDPAAPVDGDIWYDTASDDLQVEADSLTEKVSFSRYAQIYVEGASAAQSITTGGTYEKFTGFTTNGAAYGATADAANDKITLTKKGHYLVSFQVSYSGTNSSTWDFQGRWNGVVQAQLHCTRKLGAGGDVGSCSFIGIVDATSGSTDLEVWMTAAVNGNSMTAQDAQLNATWLGTT